MRLDKVEEGTCRPIYQSAVPCREKCVPEWRAEAISVVVMVSAGECCSRHQLAPICQIQTWLLIPEATHNENDGRKRGGRADRLSRRKAERVVGLADWLAGSVRRVSWFRTYLDELFTWHDWPLDCWAGTRATGWQAD